MAQIVDGRKLPIRSKVVAQLLSALCLSVVSVLAYVRSEIGILSRLRKIKVTVEYRLHEVGDQHVIENLIINRNQ